MKNLAFILGFVAGLILVALIAFVIRALDKKNNRPAKKFDERQQLLRGRAYKSAFWVLVAYVVFNGFFTLATGIEWADLMTGTFTGILLSLTVFIVACIKNDSYFPINQRPKLFNVIFTLGLVVNLALGIINLYDSDEQFLTNGEFNFHVLSFMVAIMLLAVLISLFCKRLSDKKYCDRSKL